MEQQDERAERVIAFEKKYGSTELLKVYTSALNRLLVEKGLVTEEELRKALDVEITKERKKCPDCKGTGRLETCENCVDVSDYTPLMDCPTCAGMGEIYDS